MFDTIAEAIEAAQPPISCDALAELLAARDRLDAAITALAVEVDGHRLWELDGATSLDSWLQTVGRQTRSAANQMVGRVHKLRSLPALAVAWRSGALCGGQVDTIAALVVEPAVELFARHAPDLLPTLEPLSVRETARAMRRWKANAEALLDPQMHDEQPETLQHTATLDDRWYTNGCWNEHSGHIIDKALETATSRDDPGQPRSPAQRRADAFVTVCQFFLDHHGTDYTSRNLPHLIIVTTPDDLAAGRPGRYLDTDRPASPAVVARTACEAALHELFRHAPLAKLDFGRATRDVSPYLRTALVARDGHCTFGDCDTAAKHCEAHHIHPWETGGPTRLDNLCLLCRRHHHLLHQQGWHAELTPDEQLVVTDRNGTTWRSPPRALALAA